MPRNIAQLAAELVPLSEIKTDDLVLRDKKVYRVEHIEKEPWSWFHHQGTVVGMKFTLFLTPNDFVPTARKPKDCCDKAEWDRYWKEWGLDYERLFKQRQTIEASASLLVNRVTTTLS